MLKPRYRQATNEDLHFIVDSWLKSYGDVEVNKLINRFVFKTKHREIILHCVSQCKTLVAYNAEDPDQIFGFINYVSHDSKQFITNYVYVKTAFRYFKVASNLYEVAGFTRECHHTVTAMSPMFLKFAQKNQIKFEYNPYLLFERDFK